MNEDRLNELLEQIKNPTERELLKNLCPRLRADYAQKLEHQHQIDYYPDVPVTFPDFAFPDMKIAIYCDGFEPHCKDIEAFTRDRKQSRELQLERWIVLRFAATEIVKDSKNVVDTIQKAIELRETQEAWLEKQQQKSIELEEELNQQKEKSIELRKEQQAELEKQQQKSIELEEELNQQKEKSIELRKEQQAELKKQQQKSIELEEELNQQKEKSKVWRYVAAVLGVCLLISGVLLLLQSSQRELSVVYRIDEGVVIPAGEFQMGGSDSDAEIDEHPIHTRLM